jgi:hypothetical protein
VDGDATDGDSTHGDSTHARPGHARRQLADRLVLARAQQSRGDLAAARLTLTLILADGRTLGGATVLTARRMLAEIHLDLHDTGYAHELARALFDDCTARLGAAHPATVRATCVLAATYHRLGDLDAAQRLCQQVIAVADPQRAPGRRALLLSRVLLALVAADRGATVAALARSFDEFRDRYGDADLDALRIAARLADLYAGTGELAAARRVLTRAHHAAAGRLGPAHPLTTALDAQLLRVEPPMPADEPAAPRPARRSAPDARPRRVTAWRRWWPLRSRPAAPATTPALEPPAAPVRGQTTEPRPESPPVPLSALPPRTAQSPAVAGAPAAAEQPTVAAVQLPAQRTGPWDLPPRQRLAPRVPLQRGHTPPDGYPPVPAPNLPVPVASPAPRAPSEYPRAIPGPAHWHPVPTGPLASRHDGYPGGSTGGARPRPRARALQPRGLPLWGLLAATVFAAGVAVDLGTHRFPHGRIPASSSTAAASERPTGGFQAQQLVVRDGTTPDALSVTWLDPSGGTATPLVAIATATGQTVAVATLAPGTSSYAPHGLDPDADYCAVVALYADPTDTSATASRACLHRQHT